MSKAKVSDGQARSLIASFAVDTQWEKINVNTQPFIELTPERKGELFTAFINNNFGIVIGKKQFTRLISDGEKLIIDAVDGSETLADAKEIFTGGIDSDFKNWDADEKGSAASEALAEVREMIKDATFSQMFGELNADVGKLCLTQHQIKSFVKKYRNWLQKDGYGTFFLFRSNGHFFVAYADLSSGGSLRVLVVRFEYDYVWLADARHRLVVPRLA
jgi:hypothetical protein